MANVPITGATVLFTADDSGFQTVLSRVQSALSTLASASVSVPLVSDASVLNAEKTGAATAAIAAAAANATEQAVNYDVASSKALATVQRIVDLAAIKQQVFDPSQVTQLVEAEMKVVGGATALLAIWRQTDAAAESISAGIRKATEEQAKLTAEAEATEARMTRVAALSVKFYDAKVSNAPRDLAPSAPMPVASNAAALDAKNAAEVTAVFNAAATKAKDFSAQLEAVKTKIDILKYAAAQAGVALPSAFLSAEKAVDKTEAALAKLNNTGSGNKIKAGEQVEAGLNSASAALVKIQGKLDSVAASREAAEAKVTAAVVDGAGARTAASASEAAGIENVIEKLYIYENAVKVAQLAVQEFKKVAEQAFAVQLASDKFGIPVQQLQLLSAAGQVAGVSVQQLGLGLKYMENNVGKAESGLVSGKNALALLGLSAEDLKGKLSGDVLGIFADRIQGLEDPMLREQAAIANFGRSAAGLIPFLEGGSAGIAKLTARAKELGVELTAKTTQSLASAAKASRELQQALDAAGSRLASVFAPAITAVENAVSSIVAAFSKASGELEAGNTAFTGLAKIILEIAPLLTFVAAGTVVVGAGFAASAIAATAAAAAFAAAVVAAGPFLLIGAGVGALAYIIYEIVTALNAEKNAQAATNAELEKANELRLQAANTAVASSVLEEAQATKALTDEIKAYNKEQEKKIANLGKGDIQAGLDEQIAKIRELHAAEDDASRKAVEAAFGKEGVAREAFESTKKRIEEEAAAARAHADATTALGRLELAGIEQTKNAKIAAAKEAHDVEIAAGEEARIAALQARQEATGSAKRGEDVAEGEARTLALARATAELNKALLAQAKINEGVKEEVAERIRALGISTASSDAVIEQTVRLERQTAETKKQNQEREAGVKKALDFEAELRRDFENQGKSREQLLVLKLRELGIDGERLAQDLAIANATDKAKEAEKNLTKAKEEAKKFIEEGLTIEEKTAETIAKIAALKQQRLLTELQATKAIGIEVEKQRIANEKNVSVLSEAAGLHDKIQEELLKGNGELNKGANANAPSADEEGRYRFLGDVLGASAAETFAARKAAIEAGGQPPLAGGPKPPPAPPSPAPLPPPPPPELVTAVLEKISGFSEKILNILTRWDTDGIIIKSMPPITATYG